MLGLLSELEAAGAAEEGGCRVPTLRSPQQGGEARAGAEGQPGGAWGIQGRGELQG
jgi:hypothetical protein